MAQRFGLWELEALLAVGGIGEIWRASRGTGERAAVKRLHSHLLTNDPARSQFAIEQQLASTLPRHPNLIHAVEAGAVDRRGLAATEGHPYVALDLVPGQDLRRIAAGGSALSQSRAMAIVAAACDAAAHLHAHGWIHGDINPSNLVIDSTGQHSAASGASHHEGVVLVDLGVARRVGQAGTVRGTHAYMAPEQIRGEAWTSATDVFALGVVLWELVAGARLFHRGPPWLSMAAVMETVPAPLPDPSLDAIVRSALEKDPRRRTPSPTDFAAALRNL